MRLLFFGTYDANVHPRIRVLMQGLTARGETVLECNVPLGLDTAWRVRLLRRPWLLPVLAVRLGHCWLRLWRAGRRAGDVDAVVVGYLGHFDVHLARRLWRRLPIALDYLVSGRDTATDRRISGHGLLRVLGRIDDAALNAADLVIVDTTAQHDALPERHRPKGIVVPVGATHEWFQAPARRERPPRVVFFGLYTPLQGTPTIGRAIGLLADTHPDMHFTMIGRGQDWHETRSAAREHPAVDWIDWVAPDRLPTMVAEHDICLGIFGHGPKAQRVVPNKVYQGAAAGCAVVTADTAPQREALGAAGVYVPPGDPGALAKALADLADHPERLWAKREAVFLRAKSAFKPEAVAAPMHQRLRGDVTQPSDQGAPRNTGRADGHNVCGMDVPSKSARISPPLTPNAWLRYDVVSRLLRSAEVGAKILEVGAGLGALGYRLAQDFDYTGLEQDPDSCAVARSRLAALGRGRIIHGTESSLPPNSAFDVVCAFEVIEHIEDDLEALRRWWSLLRPGGLIVLSTPAHQHRFGPADVLAGHYRRYSPEELSSRLTAAGFERASACCYGFPLGYALEAARNALARRRGHTGSMGARTGASGRMWQPGENLAPLTWAAVLPFRLLQRPWTRTTLGTGVVAWAHKPA